MTIREGISGEVDRLDIAVAKLWPDLSRSRAAALIRDGVVAIDDVIQHKPGAEAKVGARITADIPEPSPPEAQPEDLPVRIVYEDEHLAVIDKAPGMVVHPGPGHPTGTLVNALLHHLDDLSGIGGVERPGIVHRLDRGTSGLLVVAKSDVAHRDLAGQFAEHSAGRRYLALCIASPAEGGTIRSNLARHPSDRTKIVSAPKGRDAVTHWRVRARAGTLALVECRLETGRTHQIRVHLTENGMPLVGDPTYGNANSRLPATIKALVPADRPMLHAWRLDLRHPDGRRLRFEAPIPEDYMILLRAVGLAEPEGSAFAS